METAGGLKGKSVLITGASSGLGAHFAKLCASNGAHVFIGARRRSRLEALAQELPSLGAASVMALDLDVTQEASVAAAFESAASGGAPIDVVVNNAGIGGESRALDMTMADFDAVMNTNLRGVWCVSVEAGRRWKRAGRGGVIVNIASILGQRVQPFGAPYAVSKAGVVQMTRALALEWARFGIRVNAIGPGYIRTEINDELFETAFGKAMIGRIPMRRLGSPEELDGAFLLLASDASSWMTGAYIPVDGGHLVSTL